MEVIIDTTLCPTCGAYWDCDCPKLRIVYEFDEAADRIVATVSTLKTWPAESEFLRLVDADADHLINLLDDVAR